MPPPTASTETTPCACRRLFTRRYTVHGFMTRRIGPCHCLCHGEGTTNNWARAMVDMTAGARV